MIGCQQQYWCIEKSFSQKEKERNIVVQKDFQIQGGPIFYRDVSTIIQTPSFCRARAFIKSFDAFVIMQFTLWYPVIGIILMVCSLFDLLGRS